MPLPLLVPIVLGAAGLWGAGKGVKAVMDNNEAKEIVNDAQQIIENAQDDVEDSRQNAEHSLQALGALKAETVQTNVLAFLSVFSQIKNVECDIACADEFKVKEFNNIVSALTEQVNFLQSSGLGIVGGAGAGALAAYGAYSGTMLLASASTGTAISGLSGAAATNATLAWLGGGTLASGGLGVAGGTLALGSIVAGPALLIAGWYMGSKASANLDNAKSDLAQAKKFKADCDAACAMTNGITQTAQLALDVLGQLRKNARRQLIALKAVISRNGDDYKQYGDTEKTIVLRNVKIMQLLKAFLETPILNEQGEVLGDSNTKFIEIKQGIENLENNSR